MLSRVKAVVKQLPGVGPFLRNLNRRLVDWRNRRRDARTYEPWIQNRLATRSSEYPLAPGVQTTFDILTITYETDPAVLRDTAASVFAQDYPHFRWVILDNGSRKPETVAVLDELARDPRVLLHRAGENLGITRGHAAALPFLANEYVLLLDHDDLLSPDCLRVVAWHIERDGRPGYLYSDEDKCDPAGRRHYPSMKPAPSPLFILDTMYCCHLSTIRRDLLLSCGAFQDSAVEGTQDWDMAVRLFETGCPVTHINEILYTWRSTPQSTAEHGISAKPYVIASQRRCLQSALERRGLADRFEVAANRLFPFPDGHWQIRRLPTETAPAVELVLLTSESVELTAAQLRAVIQETNYPNLRISLVSGLGPRTANDWRSELTRHLGALPACVEIVDGEPGGLNLPKLFNKIAASERGAAWLAWMPPGAQPLQRDWLWEAIGCFELDSRVAMVGGRLVDGVHRTIGGAGVFGLNGAVEVAFLNASRGEPGYQGWNLCRRNVACVMRGPWVLSREALQQVDGFSTWFPRAFHEADLGKRLNLAGRQVVFSPFILAQGGIDERHSEAVDQELAALYDEHADWLRADPFYGRFFSLVSGEDYRLVTPDQRAALLNVRLAHARARSSLVHAEHQALSHTMFDPALPVDVAGGPIPDSTTMLLAAPVHPTNRRIAA
jgi:GT2 family glycosyltransferase